jgi:hypothetical protein
MTGDFVRSGTEQPHQVLLANVNSTISISGDQSN